MAPLPAIILFSWESLWSRGGRWGLTATSEHTGFQNHRLQGAVRKTNCSENTKDNWEAYWLTPRSVRIKPFPIGGMFIKIRFPFHETAWGMNPGRCKAQQPTAPGFTSLPLLPSVYTAHCGLSRLFIIPTAQGSQLPASRKSALHCVSWSCAWVTALQKHLLFSVMTNSLLRGNPDLFCK